MTVYGKCQSKLAPVPITFRSWLEVTQSAQLASVPLNKGNAGSGDENRDFTKM